jgi:hypothetical protein
MGSSEFTASSQESGTPFMNPLDIAEKPSAPVHSESPLENRPVWSSDAAILAYIGLATVVVHVLTNGKYGFHRDELATLYDGRHLAWGYVAYPPMTPFLGRVSTELFGTSLNGFRFFSALANGVSVVLTGLMARALGGRRFAQLLAAVATVPFCLGAGAVMQYVSFDYLFWVLTAYFMIRLLKSDDPRWWIAIGGSIGLGMLAKYAMLFLVAGIVVGVMLTDSRRYFTSKWLWYGVAVSFLVFLPNFLWQARHHFVALDFLRGIHERDLREGWTRGFFPFQLKQTLLATPLWVAGLYSYLFHKNRSPFRALAWMYFVPLVLFAIGQGRGYYLAPAYPMLYAEGSVWCEEWLASLHHPWNRIVRATACSALLAGVAIVAAIALPIAPLNTPWWKVASELQGEFPEQLGWQELVETVARIQDSLPPTERARMGIIAGNYGEAGAIFLYGSRYGLPQPISGVNSFWKEGYGNPPPETVIVLGMSREFVDATFASCEVVAHPWNRHGVLNEEIRDHPDIFLCRGLRKSWPDFWKDFQYYGSIAPPEDFCHSHQNSPRNKETFASSRDALINQQPAIGWNGQELDEPWRANHLPHQLG